MAHQVTDVVIRLSHVVLSLAGQLEGHCHLVMLLHRWRQVQLAALRDEDPGACQLGLCRRPAGTGPGPTLGPSVTVASCKTVAASPASNAAAAWRATHLKRHARAAKAGTRAHARAHAAEQLPGPGLQLVQGFASQHCRGRRGGGGGSGLEHGV